MSTFESTHNMNCNCLNIMIFILCPELSPVHRKRIEGQLGYFPSAYSFK